VAAKEEVVLTLENDGTDEILHEFVFTLFPNWSLGRIWVYITI
jgi:hypothetical protein